MLSVSLRVEKVSYQEQSILSFTITISSFQCLIQRGRNGELFQSGACPDVQNDVTDVSGYRDGCTTCIKYTRPLQSCKCMKCILNCDPLGENPALLAIFLIVILKQLGSNGILESRKKLERVLRDAPPPEVQATLLQEDHLGETNIACKGEPHSEVNRAATPPVKYTHILCCGIMYL